MEDYTQMAQWWMIKCDGKYGISYLHVTLNAQFHLIQLIVSY